MLVPSKSNQNVNARREYSYNQSTPKLLNIMKIIHGIAIFRGVIYFDEHVFVVFYLFFSRPDSRNRCYAFMVEVEVLINFFLMRIFIFFHF